MIFAHDVKKMVVEFLKNEPGPLKKDDLIIEVIEHSGFSESQVVDILDEMVKDREIFESEDIIYLHDPRDQNT